MKVNSLLEIIEPQVQRANYGGKFRTPRDGRGDTQSADFDNDTDLGTGFFSTVKKDKKDPHMVKKYKHQFNYDEDAFDTYAAYIMKNKLWENPYFPRIYNYKEIRDSEGKTLKKYQVEKLFPVESLSMKELEFLSNKMYKDDFFSQNAKFISTKQDAIHTVTLPIKKGVMGQKSNAEIVDDELKQAIEHVHNMYKNYCNRCVIDLHPKNFMFRKTPYGPQLVINDPVARF